MHSNPHPHPSGTQVKIKACPKLIKGVPCSGRKSASINPAVFGLETDIKDEAFFDVSACGGALFRNGI